MYLNTDLIESCLEELSDVDFRRRLWKAQIPGSMGSLFECIECLFGDSGLAEALEQGDVFSQDIDPKFQELEELAGGLIEAHDGGWDANAILSDPRMGRVTELARELQRVLPAII